MQGTGWKPRLAGLWQVVNVDAQPMHIAAAFDFLGADDRHIIFRLASDDAGVAADAGGGVDHHRPGVGVVVVIRQQARQWLRSERLAVEALRQFGERHARQDVVGAGLDLEMAVASPAPCAICLSLRNVTFSISHGASSVRIA